MAAAAGRGVHRVSLAVVVVRAVVGVAVVVRAVADISKSARSKRITRDHLRTCWSSGTSFGWQRWNRSRGRSSGCPLIVAKAQVSLH